MCLHVLCIPVWVHPYVHVYALIIYVCPRLEASVFLGSANKNLCAPCSFVGCFFSQVSEETCLFLCSHSHTHRHTLTHRKLWIFSVRLYSHAETSIGCWANSLVKTKGLTCREWNLILIYFSWWVLCKQQSRRLQKIGEVSVTPTGSWATSQSRKVLKAF